MREGDCLVSAVSVRESRDGLIHGGALKLDHLAGRGGRAESPFSGHSDDPK